MTSSGRESPKKKPGHYLSAMEFMLNPLIMGTSEVNVMVNVLDRNILVSSKGYTYLPTLPLGQDMTQGQYFWRSLTGLNSEFFFS